MLWRNVVTTHRQQTLSAVLDEHRTETIRIVMTASAVTNDKTPRIKPTPEQTDTYTRRESELRQRFLKGILDTDGVLSELQKLLEMVRNFIDCNKNPETPDWADKENPIIKHVQKGMVDPSKFATADVFAEGEEVLEGLEFIRRAQALNSMNACAFDFYSKPENWKYLPKDVDVIVFPQTEFRDAFGRRCVRCLSRDGSKWRRNCYWVGFRFGRVCRVAVLAS